LFFSFFSFSVGTCFSRRCAGCYASACVDTTAVISVDRGLKNKTYINKVDIYVENEGPVRTRMKDDHSLPSMGYGSSYSPRCGPHPVTLGFIQYINEMKRQIKNI